MFDVVTSFTYTSKQIINFISTLQLFNFLCITKVTKYAYFDIKPFETRSYLNILRVSN